MFVARRGLCKIAHTETAVATRERARIAGNFLGNETLVLSSQHFLLERYLEAHVLRKTLIAFAAAAALGSVPMATDALAAHGGGHAGGGHAGGGHSAGARATVGHASVGRAGGGRVAHYGGGHVGHYGDGRGYRYGGGYDGGYGGPIYDSCDGYGYRYGYNNGCGDYGVPLVGGIINGVLGGYGR